MLCAAAMLGACAGLGPIAPAIDLQRAAGEIGHISESASTDNADLSPIQRTANSVGTSQLPKPPSRSLARASRETGSLDIRQKVTPTVVVHGRLAVIAVDAQGELPPDGILSARLDDGRAIAAVIRWVGVIRENIYEREIESNSMGAWLGGVAGTPIWLVLHATEQPPANADGSYVVFTEIPVDAFGQGVWIEGARCDLAWVADPALESHSTFRPTWSTTTSRAAIESASLYELTEPARTNPLGRWRVRLAYEGLRPLHSMLDHAGPTIDATGRVLQVIDTKPFVGWRRFDSPELEAIALQIEGQWQSGLARVENADRETSLHVLDRLAAVAKFPSRDGIVYAPAWLDDSIQTDELARMLTRAPSPDEEMLTEVRGWLDRLPAMLAAVEDDGGRPGTEPGGATIQFGVLQCRPDKAVVIATSTGTTTTSDPVAIEPWTWHSMNVPVGITAIADAVNRAGGDPARAQIAVEARVDRQRAWASARPARLKAAPPFLALGPMMGVRTNRDVYTRDAGTVIVPGIVGGTSVHLQRTSVELEAGNTGVGEIDLIAAPGSARAWRLFIKCDALDAATDPNDTVRVWIGPTGAANLALAIDRNGSVRHAMGGQEDIDAGVVVVPGERSWSCIVTVPESSIEVDGTLRIGIERTSRAGRSTLGRSVFPWQREPGRIAIDTLAWN